MLECSCDNRTTINAELVISTGSSVSSSMIGGRDSLQFGGIAASAAILGHALTSTGGVSNHLTIVPAMAQRIGVVSNERTATTVAQM